MCVVKTAAAATLHGDPHYTVRRIWARQHLSLCATPRIALWPGWKTGRLPGLPHRQQRTSLSSNRWWQTAHFTPKKLAYRTTGHAMTPRRRLLTFVDTFLSPNISSETGVCLLTIEPPRCQRIHTLCPVKYKRSNSPQVPHMTWGPESAIVSMNTTRQHSNLVPIQNPVAAYHDAIITFRISFLCQPTDRLAAACLSVSPTADCRSPLSARISRYNTYFSVRASVC